MEENGIMMEWEIVEYCGPLEDIGGDGETYYYTDNNCAEKTTEYSKLSNWILSLGKKVVIAGVVISSVPLLIVISALSLPFGVVFASYACTDKLMSKLLSEEEEEEEQLVVCAREEEEQREAVVEEMRIDSNLKSSAAAAAGRDDEVIKVGGGHMMSLLLEEKKSTDAENEKPRSDLMTANIDDESRSPELNIINLGGSREDVTSSDVQIDKLADENHQNVADHKEEEGEQDPYLLSQDKNEKVTLATENKDKKEDSKGKSSSRKEIERRGKRKTRKEILEGHDEKLSGEERGGLIIKETETSTAQGKLGQSPEIVVQEASEDKLGSVSSDEERRIIIMLIGRENADSKQVSAKSNRNVLLNDDVDVGNTYSSLEKEEKSAVGVKEMLETHSAVNDDVCSEMNNDESNTSTGVLASEIIIANDGRVDEKIEHRTVTIYNDPGENHNQSKTIAGDGELKHDEEIPKVKEEKIACDVDGGGHSDEGLFGEDQVWKKMEAIRVIIGYKAPRGASYVEELKALYLFTGIEPPSDSAEFHNKLCFLMSVIGLK